jgi:hypothetical protein
LIVGGDGVYIYRDTMRAFRTIIAAVVLALLAGAADPASGASVDEVVGRGAAGIAQVGRPMDVVRERAEIQARTRAVDSLADAATALAMAVQGVHTEGVDTDGIRGRARSEAEGDGAVWEVHYWSNGAVTARVALPAGWATDR